MYQLPDEIIEKIEEAMRGTPQQVLASAVSKLSANYKALRVLPLTMHAEHLAYLACRLPATFAVNRTVFEILCKSLMPRSFLDIGAGPGTSLLALREQTSLEKVTLIERDSAFIALGKKLSSAPVNWVQAEALEGLQLVGMHDVTSASYMLSELHPDGLIPILSSLWAKTEQPMVLIETGTPKGYETLMRARSWLIDAGGHLLAPCPHHSTCPMPEGAWCHFAARLPRTRLHRELKGAELGYEDEKFSYLIVTKAPLLTNPRPRVVGAPCRRSGHVHLTLCTREGTIEQRTVSRNNKEDYTIAKNVSWGETI